MGRGPPRTKKDEAAEGKQERGDGESQAREAAQKDRAEIGGDSHLGDSVAGLRGSGQRWGSGSVKKTFPQGLKPKLILLDVCAG